MAGYPDEASFPGGLGFKKCLQSSPRSGNSMELIFRAHIVDLPEVEVLDMHRGKSVIQIGQSPFFVRSADLPA